MIQRRHRRPYLLTAPPGPDGRWVAGRSGAGAAGPYRPTPRRGDPGGRLEKETRGVPSSLGTTRAEGAWGRELALALGGARRPRPGNYSAPLSRPVLGEIVTGWP